MIKIPDGTKNVSISIADEFVAVPEDCKLYQNNNQGGYAVPPYGVSVVSGE